MRLSLIEAWALEVVDRLGAGQPHEDARVELKSQWTDPKRAARRIAGHANAARGQPILWLIGVDQERGILGARHEELANWYARVQAEFDGPSPSMVDLNIQYEGLAFVALLFDTERAPYVVSNPSYGAESGVSISYEVPWREGTSTRTARRAELLKLLVPLTTVPEVEVLDGELTVDATKGKLYWHLKLQVYVVPQMGTIVAFPFHRSEITVGIDEMVPAFPLTGLHMSPPYKYVGTAGMPHSQPDTHTVAHTQSEAIIQGPGQVNIFGEAWTEGQSVSFEATLADVDVRILPTHVDIPIHIHKELTWRQPDEHHLAIWIAR
jgi:hypothetical protein